jgi:glutaminase
MSANDSLPSDRLSFVSTGNLPRTDLVQNTVSSAFGRFRDTPDGTVSSVYPALSGVDPDLFGISLVSAQAETWDIGDADHPFTIQSISKPFVFALICQQLGADRVRELIGVNATGKPFNSAIAVDESPDGRTNPMVNAGAIATTSLTPGATHDDRWRFLHAGLSAFAGRSLDVETATFESAMETNFRNRGIANLLKSRGRLYADPMDAVTLYTRQCSLRVTARDLAVMGSTLAAGGVNPVTGERVIDASVCRYTLAIMTIAGLYETSGEWLYAIGLPGKSGIGGGIVTVSPGKGGLGVFAPRLDEAGNSVKGQLVTRYLSQALGLDLFVSSPGAEEEYVPDAP